MDVTNRYVLDFARRFSALRNGAEILDFGCGGGKLVQAGLTAGLRVRGTDVFYSGSNARVEAAQAGLLGSAVQEMCEARIPFPEATFDLVVNNQVMEHVTDLDGTLAEIDRVLKPAGAVLSIFPSRDVWREGHIGIPFSHRMARGSGLRLCYTWALRALGFGTWKEQAPTSRQWALDKLRWIDTYTRYRSRREIFQAYGKYFTSDLREIEYIRFRLLDRPGRAWIARLLAWPPAGAVAAALFRKLAFLVIYSRKAAG